MNHIEVRRKFIDFFVKKGHKEYPSMSLIPKDPTLLFTTAGMVQFKDAFLGITKLEPPRACSIQKCVRTTDIERVGETLRHLTFFEMLGNFSFGDYFKREAIYWGWEFLTEVMKLDKDKLYATVYEEDEESYEIWKEILPENRIYKLGKEDNFWEMGEVGPCGPCSEIIIDLGEEVGCGKETCAPGCDCDRFLEVWNLVFTQFERKKDGKLLPLKQKNIDTGMGLERLLQVTQNKKTAYETELIHPIIEWLKNYVKKEKEKSLRIVADHLRSSTFLIQEGIIPENTGRGYVLRRLIRRATLHLNHLGIEEPLLWKGIEPVIEIFKNVYPEIEEERERIALIMKEEEKKFRKTFQVGLNRLEVLLEELKDKKQKEIPGEEIFKLYDTYGFPYEIVEEIAKKEGFGVDKSSFEKLLEEAKEKSRVFWQGSGEEDLKILNKISKELEKTEFLGYEKLEVEAKVLRILRNKEIVESLKKDEEGEIILDRTTFYGESGGQIGDTGIMENQNCFIEVKDTKKFEGIIVHIVRVKKGEVKKGDLLNLKVDKLRRARIKANHTATHLLQAALRKIAGKEVKQAGSLVEEKRFRFDFTLSRNLLKEEIEKIEDIVNQWVWENHRVYTEILSYEEAKKKGALAFFGEKYGDVVRVVKVGEESISMELCGGTHVSYTGEIGIFKITSFQSISSGVKRIEAITTRSVLETLREMEETIEEISEKLKTQKSQILSRIEKLMEENKKLKKEIETGKKTTNLEEILKKKKEINGINYILEKIETSQPKILGNLIDRIKEKFSGIILLYAVLDKKIVLNCGVTDDLKEKFKANLILKEIAKILGGSAGGREDFASGGGKNLENLNKIEEKLKILIKS